MLNKAIKIFGIFIFIASIVSAKADTYQLGDLAPRGAPDGQVNAGDLVILQQIILGKIVPTADELRIGDVSPIGAGDGQLNAADLLILQRAVLGEVTLGTVDIAPPPPAAPQLDPAVTPTNENPFTVSGTAEANATIEIYLNGTSVGTTVASSSGTFSSTVVLIEGANTIRATASNSGGVSSFSSSLDVTFNMIDGGTISNISSGTTTLNANTKYAVSTSLTVGSGDTLIIEHGALLNFTGGGVTVNSGGILQIAGEAGRPVILTSSYSSPVKGDWDGIHVTQGAANVSIDNAEIGYAAIGVWFDNSGAVGGLSNTYIHNTYTGVLMYDSSSPLITNNIIINNDRGLLAYGSTLGNPEPVVTGNSIYSNPTTNFTTADYTDNTIHINATGNWWGSTVPSMIAGTIYDYTDNKNTSPVVDYSGFLTAAGGTPVPGNYLNGPLASNTTLTTGTVYTALGDVEVPAGMTLTIGSGAQLATGFNLQVDGSLVVKSGAQLSTGNLQVDGSLVLQSGAQLSFASAKQLTVNGSLDVQGTVGSEVVFTSDQPVGTETVGYWKGLLIGAGATATIDHAVVEWATNGIDFNTGTGSVTSSLIENNSNAGVYVSGSSPSLSGNVIQNNNIGIYVSGSSPTLSGNIIQNNTYGIRVTALGAPVVNGGNEITANQYGLYVTGIGTAPVVTGNSIYANTTYNYYAYGFYDSSSTRLDATGNWWGSTEPSVIATKIYDYTDNKTYSPVVDYSGFLNAADGMVVLGNYLNGLLTSDTTLTTGMIYTVLGDVEVPAGVTLTIESGVLQEFGFNLQVDGSLVVKSGAHLSFGSGKQLTVIGTLDVQGTTGSEVVFTSDQAPGTQTTGYWKGLVIASGATATIDHVVVEYADKGIYINGGSAVINASLLHFNNYGLYMQGANGSATVTASQLVYNAYYGIYAIGTQSDTTNPRFSVTGSDLFGNTYGQVYLSSYGSSSALNLDATGNWWGAPIPTLGNEIKFGAFMPATLSGVIDVSSPTQVSGKAVSIADPEYINYPGITLNVSVSATYYDIEISELVDFSDTTWQVPLSNMSVTLSSGEGVKTIYTRFRDNAGNISATFSNQVVFDTTPPAIMVTSPADGAIY